MHRLAFAAGGDAPTSGGELSSSEMLAAAAANSAAAAAAGLGGSGSVSPTRGSSRGGMTNTSSSPLGSFLPPSVDGSRPSTSQGPSRPGTSPTFAPGPGFPPFASPRTGGGLIASAIPEDRPVGSSPRGGGGVVTGEMPTGGWWLGNDSIFEVG